MEKEKAIEIFNKWMDCKDAYQADPSCDGNCFSCEYYASAEEEKEAMLLAISALEKQEQDGWIPITERMPEENDFVLVTVSGEDVRGCEWKDSMALAVWTNQWNLVDANLVSYTISAWRPLPEPYTEEEHDKP